MQFKRNDGTLSVGLIKGLTKVTLSSLSGLGFVVSVGGACTKALPYRSVLKENVISKSVIDSSAEYLYVPSIGATSRTVTGGRDRVLPFLVGTEKIVKLELTRNALQAYEVEMDPGFQGNPRNKKLVFEVPISHVEYGCQKDRLGNCRNQEEENSLIAWDKKSQFKPDFSRVNVTEANFLPESLSKLVVGKVCMTEVSNKYLDYEFGEKHINFRLERTMANDIRCGLFNYFSDLTASVVSNYSLVKLDSLSTKGYEGLSYPAEVDEEIFGFFVTERNYADVDNGYSKNQQVRSMNRWAPHRRELVYYLSDEFSKPENGLLKRAAYKTIERANVGLEAAGVQFRFRLNEPKKGINSGDMRYNMILLVEDLDWLIGYSPSVTHPRTGEVLAGRAVMFSGALKQHVWQTYEQIREQRATKENLVGGAALGKRSDGSKPQAKQTNLDIDAMIARSQREAGTPFKTLALKDESSPKESDLGDYLNLDLGVEVPDFYSMDKLMVQQHSCLLRAQSGVGGFISPEIIKAINEKFGSGELKAWEDLSATEKQFLLDLIMPEEFASTLIHELGHNLGLRHNFSGSEDEKNFYTKEELAKQGINYEVNSSSVMDYLELQGLPVFGKYDIAALRFGYQRQVEKVAGDFLQVGSTLSEGANSAGGLAKLELKKFKFCTESGLNTSLGCKRFDAGSSNTEIIDSIIRRYKRLSAWNNFRRKRNNFSIYDTDYFFPLVRAFYELRSFMEIADDINRRLLIGFNGDIKKINKERWNNSEEFPVLVDIRQAAVKAGRFFLEVLKTPELTCFVGKKDDPNGAPMLRPLAVLDLEALSCSQAKLSEEKVLLGEVLLPGEVGRFFQDKEDPEWKKNELTTKQYDQIAVRGSWLDKTLAARFLFARRISEDGSFFHLFDRSTGGFMDEMFGPKGLDPKKLPEGFVDLRGELTGFLKEIMLNRLVISGKFRFTDGREMSLSIPFDVLKTHNAPRPLFTALARFLRLPTGREVNFIEVLGQQMLRQTNSLDQIRHHRDLAWKDLNRLGVYKTTDVLGSSAEEGALSLVLGGTKYVAMEENEVASALIYRCNGDADKLITKAVRYLSDNNKKSASDMSEFIAAMDAARGNAARRMEEIGKLSPVQQEIANLPDDLYEEIRGPLNTIVTGSYQHGSDITAPARKFLADRVTSNIEDAQILKMLPVLDAKR